MLTINARVSRNDDYNIIFYNTTNYKTNIIFYNKTSNHCAKNRSDY